MKKVSALFRCFMVFLVVTGCELEKKIETSPLQEEAANPAAPPPAGAMDLRAEGYLDVIGTDGLVQGWALSRGRGEESVQVAFYLDGPKGQGRWLGTVDTSVPRADVTSATGVAGDHGFQFALPSWVKDGNDHELFAYGLSSLKFYAGNDAALLHRSGYSTALGWATDVGQPSDSHVVYGPYTSEFPRGNYVARFELQIDNADADNVGVAHLDVFDAASGQVLAERSLTRREFTQAGVSTNFLLPFTAPDASLLEFRVLYLCCSAITHVSTSIFPSSVGSRPPGSASLGNSPMAFRFDRSESVFVSHTKAQILDTQGDLMIWGGPEFAIDCSTGQDPETGIRCRGDHGGTPRGLMQGWVWTLTIPRYTAARREQLYQKIKSYGYTHVAIQVTQCQPGEGYHAITPMTAQDCVNYGDHLNTVLREIRGHGLITWCTGLTHNDPPQEGLDRSLCEATLDDWDNTAKKDCHINAIAGWFPDAWHFIEMPEANVQPERDECTPPGLLPATNGGGAWIAAAQRRDPKLVGVALEVSVPRGQADSLRAFREYNAWWRDLVQNRFETDTYWKFWDGMEFEGAKAYNDWFLANAPWLQGFMSGGSSHPPIDVEVGAPGEFAGELDIRQAQLHQMPAGFADWPITTRIKKVELTLTGVKVTMDNGRPEAWPNTTPRPDMGELLYSLGIAERIDGVWHASAPIQLWRGLVESGGQIQLQDVRDGSGRGQINANWFYDRRWGPMSSYNPRVGEQIGIFVCAGDCRDGNAAFSPVHERSNVVLLPLPRPNEPAVFSEP